MNPSAYQPDNVPALGPDQLAFLVDIIPQLVWVTDPTGFHTYFNQRWTDYTGYTLADSVGPSMWNNLLHPDDQERARQVWGHSLATGENYEIEYRFKGKDGGYRWFMGQARPQRDAQGAITTWFGTCTDIEDKKVALDQLQQREEDFKTLANAIPQFAWMADTQGNIFWYNDRWYDYTGATAEEMATWNWRNVHHPDHVASVTEQFAKAISSGEPWQDTFPLRGKDGEYRWFLSRALPVHDAQGAIVRWCGTNTDVTEERRLQEQLVNSYADLEAKVTFRTLDLEHQVQVLQQRLAGH